jgi:hypothetical protein
MKNKLRFLALALVAGGTMFAQSRLSIDAREHSDGRGSDRPPAYTQQYAEQRDGNQRRDFDRDDRGRARDRGYDNQQERRGVERACSNDFRR